MQAMMPERDEPAPGTPSSAPLAQQGKKRRGNEKKRPPIGLLACPFYKLAPKRHMGCARLQLTSVSYVKQHLTRHHRRPMQCPVCGEGFDRSQDWEAHIRARECAGPLGGYPVEGITEEQRVVLGQRAKRGDSEESQWFSIWDTLFPKMRRPESVYLGDPVEDAINILLDTWQREAPDIIRLVGSRSRPNNDHGFPAAADDLVLRTSQDAVDELLLRLRDSHGRLMAAASSGPEASVATPDQISAGTPCYDDEPENLPTPAPMHRPPIPVGDQQRTPSRRPQSLEFRTLTIGPPPPIPAPGSNTGALYANTLTGFGGAPLPTPAPAPMTYNAVPLSGMPSFGPYHHFQGTPDFPAGPGNASVSRRPQSLEFPTLTIGPSLPIPALGSNNGALWANTLTGFGGAPLPTPAPATMGYSAMPLSGMPSFGPHHNLQGTPDSAAGPWNGSVFAPATTPPVFQELATHWNQGPRGPWGPSGGPRNGRNR